MKPYIELMRPAQWIKNLAVLAGPIFAFKVDPLSLFHTAMVFASFCLASSASYCINDTIDRATDMLHPIKRFRPIARGDASPAGAVVWGVVLFAAAVMLSYELLPIGALVVVIAYFATILSYSLALKKRMILDVILIAVGFVLRATAGAFAVAVHVSPWLIVCTFTLCLFLGFGKRRCEVAQFKSAGHAGLHRSTLQRYTPELLNHLISVSAGIAIMTFLLYTMDNDPRYAPPFPKEHLLYTMPLVAYGIFRFAMLAQAGERHGPMDIFLHDRAFQATIVVWAVITLVIMIEDRWLDPVRGALTAGGA